LLGLVVCLNVIGAKGTVDTGAYSYLFSARADIYNQGDPKENFPEGSLCDARAARTLSNCERLTLFGEGKLRIYCDTSALRSNISRHTDEESQTELASLEQLTAKYSFFGSHLVRYEAQNTKDEIQRGYLIIDVAELQNVPHDDKLLGFNVQINQYVCINSPIISDVQDEGIRAELMARRLKQRDAEHITQAVCNHCDVFLTRDKGIRKRRQWLEGRFPGLKIRLPSELAAELSQ
jgi:hypothetical protein